MAITLTEQAINKVKTFAAKEANAEGKGLRIYVQGGGCSGFQYGFSFDEKKEGDTIIEKDDIKVIIDSFSAPYLKDSIVDYIEDFRGSSFVVRNPNAKATCGCGSSFTV